ncbi:MAG: ribosome-associated protein [Actinomycetota bacterium]|nr:ribosome-associated protein [Actinomycetota bacterium]
MRDDGIRLGQFLKLAGLADTGADARVLLGLGEVEVNGEPEARRGRQLSGGDVVAVGDDEVRVVARP